MPVDVGAIHHQSAGQAHQGAGQQSLHHDNAVAALHSPSVASA